VLQIRSLTTRYGGIVAVRDMSLDIVEGEMIAVIGRNGAGKSTLLNTISGVLKPAAGTIFFDGWEIDGKRPHQIAKLGLMQVPEGRQILGPLSVEENLELGRQALGKRKQHDHDDLAKVYEIFPILAERRLQAGGSLSGGQQQMLAIGRAIMGQPSLLLLDEPSLGLDPIVTEQVFRALTTLNRNGLTILLVEQNARRALEITNRAYVVEQGRIVDAGASSKLARDPRILKHYLGVAEPQ
jgi:branched-chain amino acid transport system ATP-binding protein